MKVANDKDYDDYNEYAYFLAQWLSDKLANELPAPVYASQSIVYKWLQEFNRTME